MKRPAFQFYPADWKSNAKLRRCSEGARGAWMDVLCLLHDCDDYGVIPWPLADIARAAGVPVRLLKELSEKGVLKGSDKGCPGYVFTPRHAGKDGDPVILLEATESARWYCSRFVRDEYIRQRRGFGSQFTETKQPPKASPKPPLGDGPSSSSSSSSARERERRAPALEFSDRMPTDAARDMTALLARINALLPPWSKRPHLTRVEMDEMLANADALFAISDDDWKLLGAYVNTVIPEEWGKFWQPDSRAMFIKSVTDVLNHADRWKTLCKRKNVVTGLEEKS